MFAVALVTLPVPLHVIAVSRNRHMLPVPLPISELNSIVPGPVDRYWSIASVPDVPVLKVMYQVAVLPTGKLKMVFARFFSGSLSWYVVPLRVWPFQFSRLSPQPAAASGAGAGVEGAAWAPGAASRAASTAAVTPVASEATRPVGGRWRYRSMSTP
jgi:hypothetical protein